MKTVNNYEKHSYTKVENFNFKLLQIIVMLLLGIFVGILSVYFTSAENSSVQIFFLGFLTLLASLFIALLRIKYFGLADALALFSLFFASYNGLLLVQITLNVQSKYVVNMPYPIVFSTETYVKAGMLSFIAALGLLMGGVISLTTNTEKNNYENEAKLKNDFKILFYVGFLTFCFGILLFFLNYQRIGGFFYALSLSRGVRMALLSQTRGNLPYVGFVFSGIALMCYSYLIRKNTAKKCIFYLSMFVWLVLMFLEGDRRFTVYSLIIILGIAGTFYSKRIKLNFRFICLILLIYLLFIFIAQTRWLFPLLISNQMSLNGAIKWIIENISFEWLLPAKNEFAGPYFTLLYSLEYSQEKLYGISYLNSLINWLPRSLYPGEKPPTIAQQFAYLIYELYTPGRESVVGWGYSPVAEALNNFGFIGVLVIFLILGVSLGCIEKIRRRGLMGLMIYSMFLPEVLNLNRINFSSVFGEIVFNVGTIVAVLLFYILLKSINEESKI